MKVPTRALRFPVVIRDVLAASARDVREAVEAAASVFAADAGGFSQMEIVLCGWNEDIVRSTGRELFVGADDRSVGAAAGELFGSLSRRDAKAGQRSAGHEWAGQCPGARSMQTFRGRRIDAGRAKGTYKYGEPSVPVSKSRNQAQASLYVVGNK
jgi:hypothetical protein